MLNNIEVRIKRNIFAAVTEKKISEIFSLLSRFMEISREAVKSNPKLTINVKYAMNELAKDISP